jgi:hypothetical protein
LLSKVRGVEVIEIDRPDECCGFGGSFCITDEAVYAKMGYDRVHDFHRSRPGRRLMGPAGRESGEEAEAVRRKIEASQVPGPTKRDLLARAKAKGLDS